MKRLLVSAATLALVILFPGGVSGQAPSDEKPLTAWINQLQDPGTPARLEALQAIRKLGPQAQGAVPALIETLGDNDPEVRAAAARALGAVGPAAEPAIPALMKALTDTAFTSPVDGEEASPVWFTAANALGDVGPAALPDLIAALDDEHPLVCVGACGAIGRMGAAAKEAVEPLVKVLKRDELPTRRAAIYGLMGIGPEAKAAVPALIDVLTHEDFHTQYWACRALRDIGPGAKAAVPVLVQLLGDAPASVRRHAAQALGGIGPEIGEEALQALAKAIRDPLEPVREDAVIALGKLGPFAKPAAPALKEALAQGPLSARVPAAKALWLITGRTETAVDVLIGELGDYNWGYQAAQVLGAIGPPAKKAAPALVAMLRSEDALLRTEAAQALKRIAPESLPPEGSP